MQPTQKFCVPIATMSLRPYVTHMSDGRDLIVSSHAATPSLETLIAPRGRLMSERRLLDAGSSKTPLVDRIREKAPAVYLDIDNKLGFLVEWQDSVTAHYEELGSFMEQFPADLNAMPDDQKQLFARGFVEMSFNYFAGLAELYSKHAHNLGMETYSAHQPMLAKMGFRQLTVVAEFYNAFEMAVNQMDRILFAEIPAKAKAQTLSFMDILSWKDTLLEVFFDARDRALELIDAK